MKVFHVVNSKALRGAEIFAADLVNELRRLGLEQQVAVLKQLPPPSVDYGFPTRQVGRDQPWRGTKTAASFLSLRKLIQGFRPDFITVHGGDPLKYAVVALVGLDYPIVYRRISSAHRYINSESKRRFYKLLIHRATHIVAVAESLVSELVQIFDLPPERITYIPRAVDMQRLRPTRARNEIRAEIGIDQDAPVLLSLGALSWEKNPIGAVEIAGRALERVPGSHYIVVGDGTLRHQVAAAMSLQPARAKMHLLGSRVDVADLLTASDVLLLPSHTEGMPGAVIEAGIAGIPAVSFDVGGVSEVVIHEETGLLAPGGRSEILEDNAVRLLTDLDERKKMGTAAQERNRSHFDIRKIAPRYVDLYEHLDSGRTPS